VPAQDEHGAQVHHAGQAGQPGVRGTGV